MGNIKRFAIYLLRFIANIHLRIIKKYEVVIAEESLKKLGINVKVKLEGLGIIHDPNELIFGDNIFLGRNYFIRAAGKVSIGSYTHISRNVVIHTVNHNINGQSLPYDKTNILAPVTIGNYVWIGMNVCILPGVTIGDGAVIGMGTIVSKDVMPGDIVVGSAQRVVSQRDKQHTEKMLKTGSFLTIESSK